MALSRLAEYLRFRLIDSPLERPARAVRQWMLNRQIRRAPELRECLCEDQVIDAVLRNHITDGMHCVDVGAHLGTMLSRFVRYSPSGTHAAFEPVDYKARWLQRRFPKHAVHACAASDSNGEVEFFFQPASSGYSGLRRHDAGVNHPENGIRLRVKTCRLDDVLPNTRKVSVLKIDVEGAELQVLHGASDTIERDRPMILFECARTALDAFQLQPTALFDLLHDRFRYELYTPTDCLNGGAALDRDAFDAATRYPFRAFNFFALPR